VGCIVHQRSSQRSAGIIRCELYVGRLVWNKVRMAKDPKTGKQVSRPSPPHEWQSVELPDLAIVTRGLFDASQQRKAQEQGHSFQETASAETDVVRAAARRADGRSNSPTGSKLK
jgi:hypothetical protein